MRNGRDRRSGKPVMGHAILERALLVGTRSADHIRASSHSGCIATGQASARKTGRIHGCTRTLRRKVRFLLHRGHRPYMARSGGSLRRSDTSAVGRIVLQSRPVGGRPSKVSNNRIRKGGFLNQNSLLRTYFRTAFFAVGTKIVLQHGVIPGSGQTKAQGISSPGTYEADLMWPRNDGERQRNIMLDWTCH